MQGRRKTCIIPGPNKKRDRIVRNHEGGERFTWWQRLVRSLLPTAHSWQLPLVILDKYPILCCVDFRVSFAIFLRHHPSLSFPFFLHTLSDCAGGGRNGKDECPGGGRPHDEQGGQRPDTDPKWLPTPGQRLMGNRCGQLT